MFFLWVFLILVILGLCVAFAVVRFQALEVDKRADILKEALWDRRNRIPLLLEVLQRCGGLYEEKQPLIDLKEKVSSEAYSLEEQMKLEKNLSRMLSEIFRKSENQAPFKSDTLFLSLKKEFADGQEAIRIALNGYNFELEKWHRRLRIPWLKVFGFAFEISKNKPLEFI